MNKITVVNHRLAFVGGCWLLAAASLAQIPDQLNTLDPGGKSMGSGGAMYVTNADTLSAFFNPAGLGFLTRAEIGLAYRNLPTSRSSIGNTYANPSRSTRGQSGGSTITHLGYAFPFRAFGKGSGTLAVTYTVGGFIDDVGVGPAAGLPDGTGAFTIDDYLEHTRAKAEYFTLAYGKTNPSGNVAYGLGVTFLNQSVEYSQSGSPASVFQPFRLSSNGNGLGVIGGIQYIPARTPNFSVGFSLRSPIDLGNNGATAALYDRVPGRAIIGAAYRRDGMRDGKDFAVLGAQVQHFFGGRGSQAFDRGTQTTTGLGLEYNYGLGEGRIPLRLGYQAVPSGGAGFGSRNAFTYGIGFRPEAGDYGIDISWAAPQGGGRDMAISATYRFR